MPDPTPQQILACPMGENDADAETVGDYLIQLLHLVWKKQEGFSGKKPFGNSGWDGELHRALWEADFLGGELDEDGYLGDYDDERADQLIHAAIDAMAQSPDPTPDVPDGFCPGVEVFGSAGSVERHPARPYQLRYNGHCQACATHFAIACTNQGSVAPAWAVRALIDRLQFEKGRSVVDL